MYTNMGAISSILGVAERICIESCLQNHLGAHLPHPAELHSHHTLMTCHWIHRVLTQLEEAALHLRACAPTLHYPENFRAGQYPGKVQAGYLLAYLEKFQAEYQLQPQADGVSIIPQILLQMVLLQTMGF